MGSLSLRLARSPARGFVPSIAADRRSPGLLLNGLLQCQDFHLTSFAKLAWRTRIDKIANRIDTLLSKWPVNTARS